MEQTVAEALVASANAPDSAARDAAYRQLHQLAASEASFLSALFVPPDLSIYIYLIYYYFYYLILVVSLQTVAGKGQDHMVRFLALTFLKNFVQRFWADDQGYTHTNTLCPRANAQLFDLTS
jgi:hypothetical protein